MRSSSKGGRMSYRLAVAILASFLSIAAAPHVNIARVRPRFQTQATQAPSCAGDPPGTCKLTYYGGHVIPNAKIYRVDWTAAAATPTVASLDDFLQKVSNSAYLDWLYEY